MIKISCVTVLAMTPSALAQVNFQLQAEGRPFQYDDQEGSGWVPVAKSQPIEMDPTRACWTCKDASSYGDCFSNGKYESCNAADDSCMLEVRRYESTTRISTGCMPQAGCESL